MTSINYNFIVDPVSNRKYYLFSQKGGSLLASFIQQYQLGGSNLRGAIRTTNLSQFLTGRDIGNLSMVNRDINRNFQESVPQKYQLLGAELYEKIKSLYARPPHDINVENKAIILSLIEAKADLKKRENTELFNVRYNLSVLPYFILSRNFDFSTAVPTHNEGDIIASLIDHKANINDPVYAIEKNRISNALGFDMIGMVDATGIEYLLRFKADPNINITDVPEDILADGPVIQESVCNVLSMGFDYMNAVTKLLEAKANVNSSQSQGQTQSKYAIPLHENIFSLGWGRRFNNGIRVIRSLINAKANVNYRYEHFKDASETVLFAINNIVLKNPDSNFTRADISYLLDILNINRELDYNNLIFEYSELFTPIAHVLDLDSDLGKSHGFPTLVNLLLEKKSDINISETSLQNIPNVQNIHEYIIHTPLSLAIAKVQDTNIIKELLDIKANPDNIHQYNGNKLNTSLSISQIPKCFKSYLSGLSYHMNYSKEVINLLIDHKADINATTGAKGNNLIQQSISEGTWISNAYKLDFLKLLIDMKVDLDHKNNSGETTIDLIRNDTENIINHLTDENDSPVSSDSDVSSQDVQ